MRQDFPSLPIWEAAGHGAGPPWRGSFLEQIRTWLHHCRLQAGDATGCCWVLLTLLSILIFSFCHDMTPVLLSSYAYVRSAPVVESDLYDRTGGGVSSTWVLRKRVNDYLIQLGTLFEPPPGRSVVWMEEFCGCPWKLFVSQRRKVGACLGIGKRDRWKAASFICFLIGSVLFLR